MHAWWSSPCCWAATTQRCEEVWKVWESVGVAVARAAAEAQVGQACGRVRQVTLLDRFCSKATVECRQSVVIGAALLLCSLQRLQPSHTMCTASQPAHPRSQASSLVALHPPSLPPSLPPSSPSPFPPPSPLPFPPPSPPLSLPPSLPPSCSPSPTTSHPLHYRSTGRGRHRHRQRCRSRARVRRPTRRQRPFEIQAVVGLAGRAVGGNRCEAGHCDVRCWRQHGGGRWWVGWLERGYGGECKGLEAGGGLKGLGGRGG